MERIRSPETSVPNQPTLHNIPQDNKIQVNRSESLRSRILSIIIVDKQIILQDTVWARQAC